MNRDFVVPVVYRNERQEPIYSKVYSLEEYTAMIRADLLRLISDVEDMAYEANDNKSKSEWSDSTWAAFCRIKHKQLDKAGEIGRQCSSMSEVENTDGTSGLEASGY